MPIGLYVRDSVQVVLGGAQHREDVVVARDGLPVVCEVSRYLLHGSKVVPELLQVRDPLEVGPPAVLDDLDGALDVRAHGSRR